MNQGMKSSELGLFTNSTSREGPLQAKEPVWLREELTETYRRMITNVIKRTGNAA